MKNETLESDIASLVAAEFPKRRSGKRIVCEACGRGPCEGAMIFSAYSDVDWKHKRFLDRDMPAHFCSVHVPFHAPRSMKKRVADAIARWGEGGCNDFAVGAQAEAA